MIATLALLKKLSNFSEMDAKDLVLMTLMGLFLVHPFGMGYVLKRQNPVEVHEKYHMVFKKIKIEGDSANESINFYTWFHFRKMALLFSPMIIAPIFQIQISLSVCMWYSAYIVSVPKFKTRRERNLEVINEFLFFMLFLCLPMFTDFISDSQVQYDSGLVFLGIVALLMLVNIINLMAIIAGGMIDKVQEMRNRRENKELFKPVLDPQDVPYSR